jgi:hypothetical protein
VSFNFSYLIYLTDFDMPPHPVIRHPKFHRQSRFIIFIRNDSGPNYIVHVSQVYEAIKYSDSILSVEAKHASRRAVPLGYQFLAATWNTFTTTQRYFAILRSAVNSGENPTVQIAGAPITIYDFHFTLEDCGLGRPVEDPDMLALTRHIAMNTVYGRQKQNLRQQQRSSRSYHEDRVPPFKHTKKVSVGNKRRREDEDGYFQNPGPDYFEALSASSSIIGPDFTTANQTYPSHYLTVDEDTTMANPGASTITFGPDNTELQNIEALHELPHFDESENNPITETTTAEINLSLLEHTSAPIAD